MIIWSFIAVMVIIGTFWNKAQWIIFGIAFVVAMVFYKEYMDSEE